MKPYLPCFIILLILLIPCGCLDELNMPICLPFYSISFDSLSHKLACTFSLIFYLFLLYPSIKAFIYLCIAVSDDEHPPQCLAQADKVYGCVMECSSLQHGSDVNKLIF